MSSPDLTKRELALLFCEHREELEHFVSQQTSEELRPRISASEVVQDAFLWAEKNLPLFSDQLIKNSFTCLKTICNVVLIERETWEQSSIRSPLREIVLSKSSLDGLEDPAPDHPSKNELVQEVISLIMNLPEHDQLIIEMRHVNRFSFGQISRRLAQPVDNIKKRYYRSLKKIKHLFEKRHTKQFFDLG